MNDIIRQIQEALVTGGMDNVYSAFDALPVRDKGKYFTVVGIRSYEVLPQIYTDNNIYMPYKADAEIKITAPENSSQEELYDIYECYAEGALEKLTRMDTRLRVLEIAMDKTLNRLVLTAVIKVGGMRIIPRERSDEE